MYYSQEVFISSFIASLRKINVTEFPFGNSDFFNGIQCMQSFYTEHVNELGKYKNELRLLFIKKTIGNSYEKFAKAISKQNGELLSFPNPDYVIANICVDKEGANYILKNQDLGINENIFISLAKKFCIGAGIRI